MQEVRKHDLNYHTHLLWLAQSRTMQEPRLYLMLDARRYLDAPGDGQFTVEQDRLQIARVLLGFEAFRV